MKFRVFWDLAPCSHVAADRRFRGAFCIEHQGDDEAVRTSETSVNFNVTTRRYIPEHSKLQDQSCFDEITEAKAKTAKISVLLSIPGNYGF
jgi:hypothetical protein